MIWDRFGYRTRAGMAAATGLAVAVLLSGCHQQQASMAGTASAGSDTEEGSRLIAVSGSSGVALDDASQKLAGVATETAGVTKLAQTVQPDGEIAPTDADTVQVTSRLPGRITEARVLVGSRVRKGDVIAMVDSIDLTQAEATYRTALSHEKLALHQLEQEKSLAKYGTISEQPVEDARKALAAAEASVVSDEAQVKLDQLTLENTRQLVALGEITHKPVEDAQNAYAQAQGALAQAKVTLRSTKANFDRTTILFNGGIFSKQQLEDAETAYNTAVAAEDQAVVQENLAAAELKRQQNIYTQNLNGASSLQTAESKLIQDQHMYTSDLVAQELAKTQLTRAQVVHKSGIPISQALQAAEDNYDEAEVAVQGAANSIRLYGVSPDASVAELSNGHIVIPVLSPIDGIVTMRSMVVGQMTDAATPLVKVVNLDRVYVDAQVYEKDIASIHTGDPVQLHVTAFPNRTFSGTVSYVANDVNPDTRTMVVRTVIQNPGWQLRPGMYATVLIGSLRGVHSIAIPADAVLQDGARQIVYVEVAPGQFVQRSVTTGMAINGRVPIRSGLNSGDKVVVAGNVLLQQEQSKLESEKRGSA